MGILPALIADVEGSNSGIKINDVNCYLAPTQRGNGIRIIDP